MIALWWYPHLHTVAAVWAATMVRASWQGALLVGAVWGICRLFPRLPAATRCLLWWLTCLKLLVSLVLVSPIALPVLPGTAPRLQSIVRRVLPAHRLPGERTGRAALRNLSQALPETAVAHLLPQAIPPADAPPVRRHTVSPTSAALCLWLIGVALCLAATARQFRRVSLLVQQDDDTTAPEAVEMTAQIAQSLGLRQTPPVRVSAAAPGPLVIGWRRPTVLLPLADVDRLTAAELRGVLAHELAHIRRCDLLLAIVPVLVRSLFFFHPLVWLACREYELAQEAACDAEAVRNSGTRPDVYGRLLLKLGTTGRQSPSYRAAALGVTADYRLLLRRLQGLEALPALSYPSPVVSRLAITGLAAVSLVPVQVTAQPARHHVPVVRPAQISPEDELQAQKRADEAEQLARTRQKNWVVLRQQDATKKPLLLIEFQADAAGSKGRRTVVSRVPESLVQHQLLEQRRMLEDQKRTLQEQRSALARAHQELQTAKLQALQSQRQMRLVQQQSQLLQRQWQKAAPIGSKKPIYTAKPPRYTSKPVHYDARPPVYGADVRPRAVTPPPAPANGIVPPPSADAVGQPAASSAPSADSAPVMPPPVETAPGTAHP